MGPRRALLLALAVTLVVGGVSQTAAAATGTRVRGTFALADRQFWIAGEARACAGTGLYGDVGEGTPVSVRDERGAVIAETTLGAGHSTYDACVFDFTVELPPAHAYTIEVGVLADGGLVYRETWDAAGVEQLASNLVFGIGDEMLVRPSRARPGAALSAHFPGGGLRGLGYRVDRRSHGRWSPAYWLTSDRQGETPTAVPADKRLGVNDIAVTGTMPDGLVLPDDIPAGRYRVCADRTAHCTRLDVVGRRR
jgi:hypothetical protein